MNRTIPHIVYTLCVLIAGCGTFDGDAIRRRHADAFSRDLGLRTDSALARTPVFTLDECVRYALMNNLSFRAAQIDQQVARLQRRISFSYFLPAVSFNTSHVVWDPNPMMELGFGPLAMHDKRVREITWNVQTAIFDPSTWFLYSMYTRGEEISQLVTEYTRQMITLQVTGLYYYCLSLQESIASIQSRIAAAESLHAQLRSLAEEGMLSAWQADEAGVFLQSHRNDLQKTQDTLRQTRGDLQIAMGLSPLASIELGGPGENNAPQGSLEDLIYQAMVNHPGLKISDRAVAIEEEKVKIAIAGFLPRLYGFATHTSTTESQLSEPKYWMAGLSGAISVFNGFATISDYEAAKKNREKAFLEREEQTLTLMAEVQRANMNLQTAANDKRLAEQNLDVAQAQYDEAAERWKEGLMTSTDLLSIMARRDQARMGVLMASYHHQVTVATMRQVMGLMPIDTNRTNLEDQTR